MQALVAQCRSLIPLDTSEPHLAICVGSPGGGLLQTVKKVLSVTGLHVFEVDEANLQELRQLEAQRVLKVHTHLIGSKSGQQTYYRFNQRRFNGYTALSAKQMFSPNIRKTGTDPVSAKTLAQVCSDLDIRKRGEHVLLFGIQGAQSVLLAPEQLQALRLFRFVVLQLPPDGFFESSPDNDAFEQGMRDAGFFKVIASASTLYPMQDVLFQRDDDRLFREETLAELQEALKARDSLQQALAEANKQLETERCEFAVSKSGFDDIVSAIKLKLEEAEKTKIDCLETSALKLTQLQDELRKADEARLETEKTLADQQGEWLIRIKNHESELSAREAIHAAECKSLRASLAELQLKLEQCGLELSEARQKLKRQSETSEIDVAEVKQRLAESQKKLSEAEQQSSKLIADRKSVQEQLERSLSEKSVLQGLESQLRTQSAQLTEQLQAVDKEIEAQKRTLKAQAATLGQRQNEIERLRSELRMTKVELEELKIQSVQTAAALEQCKEALSARETEFEALQALTNELHLGLQQAEGQLKMARELFLDDRAARSLSES